jgi:glycosyltransferase involved in cell wall biosynthesis
MSEKKKKLAVLANVIAPYRVPILASLAETFDTLILHGGTEPNRTWTIDLPKTLKTRRVFTLKIPRRKKTGTLGVSDTAYLHLNIGLVWWLIRFRPDVILTNEMGLRTATAVIYGKLTGTPVWVWWGGTLHSERNINPARKIIRRCLVHLIGRWLSYGATSTEYLESIGVPRKQILQIQNCVPQEIFETVPSGASDLIKSARRPLILSVGQLIQRKGIDKLIEACGRLRLSGDRFSLVIVGQGPELSRLRTLARENGIEDFEILPNQPQTVLNEIYHSADVFVFPTLEDNWGLVVNEAMWAGLPVLCSSYAGCAPELLPESNIFDPMSPESFDRALMKVMDNSIPSPDRSTLLTWQEVSSLMSRSLASGMPVSRSQEPTHRRSDEGQRYGRRPQEVQLVRASSASD